MVLCHHQGQRQAAVCHQGCSLPSLQDLYSSRCVGKIADKPFHSGHPLFKLQTIRTRTFSTAKAPRTIFNTPQHITLSSQCPFVYIGVYRSVCAKVYLNFLFPVAEQRGGIPYVCTCCVHNLRICEVHTIICV